MTSTSETSHHFSTIQEIVLEAHRRLSKPIWDYVTYGAETETTVRRNRYELDCLALKPRIARDMSEIDISSSLLGHYLRIPALLAPMGSIARFDSSGAIASARAAQEFGILQMVASHADSDTAFTREASLPLIYALHPHGDEDEIGREVEQAVEQGFLAISVATQSLFYSRRERDVMNGLLGKGQMNAGYAQAVAKHHRVRAKDTPDLLQKTRLSWTLIESIKKRSNLPLILKGVQTVEDAKLAIQHGVDVIYVSNNGGRALDHAPATIGILPRIIEAVGHQVPVIMDGGIARGTDIIKALALGATAVCLGRLQAWALAADGTRGVVRMLELLEEEMIISMGLLGVSSVANLTPDVLEAVPSCIPPHPLSAFPVAYEQIIRRW